VTDTPPIVRIAHAYGNSRGSLQIALASEADMIEVDMWYRGGDLYIRHERRLRWLPILYDQVMKGHKLGPFAIRIGKYFIRPDIHTLKLDELLETVDGQKRLLLDVKGYYHAPQVDAYVETLVRKIREHGAERWVAVCGQTYPVLHRLREIAPEIQVRYSIQQEYQWERFLRLMENDPTVRSVCIAYGFIDADKARLMEERDVDLYCWTVDDWDDARRLVRQGVDGIISNDLKLLAALPDFAATP
jgi:glycerophosphoryl diester phosphodiesterase